MNKTALLPVQLFDKVYQYLMDKPYREVGPLIEEIKEAVQVAEIPEESIVENKDVEDAGTY